MKRYFSVGAILLILGGLMYVYSGGVEKQQVLEEPQVTETEKAPLSTTQEMEVTEDQEVVGTLPLKGKCAPGVSGIHTELLAKVHSNSYATFSCSLDDGTFVVGGVGQLWSHDFRVVHFDNTGNELNVFTKNNGTVSGGEFTVSDIVDGRFQISHHVVDPCYDAMFTFTFDLNTGTYTEVMKGGDDMACLEELNGRGGV